VWVGGCVECGLKNVWSVGWRMCGLLAGERAESGLENV
jgi:hypothetical protein